MQSVRFDKYLHEIIGGIHEKNQDIFFDSIFVCGTADSHGRLLLCGKLVSTWHKYRGVNLPTRWIMEITNCFSKHSIIWFTIMGCRELFLLWADNLLDAFTAIRNRERVVANSAGVIPANPVIGSVRPADEDVVHINLTILLSTRASGLTTFSGIEEPHIISSIGIIKNNKVLLPWVKCICPERKLAGGFVRL